MPLVRLFLLVFAQVLALSACGTGRDFAPASEALLTLGVTTEADVRAQFGEPVAVRRETTPLATVQGLPSDGSPFDPVRVEGSYAVLAYDYSREMAARLASGLGQRKSATFTFWNGVLVDYVFLSNMAGQETNFDVDRLLDVVKGQTIESQVVSLLGPPAGRGIFPMVRDPGARVLHYGYHNIETVLFGFQTANIENKWAEVLIDPRGFVLDYRASILPPSQPAVPSRLPNPEPK